MYGSILEESDTDVGRSPIIEDLYSPELGFSDAPTPFTVHSSRPLSVESLRDFTIGTPWDVEGLFVVPVLVQCPGLSGKRLIRGIDQFELEDGYSAESAFTIVEDPRSRMDRLERRIRQMRDPDEMISWDDPDDVPVATLPVGFRMPDIERYTGVGCPRIHLRLYSTVMRALGLDEAQLLTLFPLSLSGMTQRWYASLESSRRRTWEDLAQEFLRQYSFSGDTSVTRRELEFLRQGSDESVSSFISRWREKAAEMIERPTERDQMSMFLRSLHPRFARHLTGVPFQDFRSLVQALFDVDDGISRGLWSDIIPSQILRGRELVDHLRAMETYVLRTFSIDDLVIIPMRDHCRYPGVISHLYSIVILIQFSSTLLCILILSRCDLHFSFSVHRLVSHA
ncbi:hypothetical protein CK203_009065 [Vitis vinifera]|uniref:Retrotransposon gag domain-containing protein n=1 Tax=Vitis vinifera TaxID=29760 RepID=A0A438K2Y7_VITVI|nr:hypothetical protein CK203_009065 [Vitis vinifera]